MPPQVLASRQMVEPRSKFSAGSSMEVNCGRVRRGSTLGGMEKAAADDIHGGGGGSESR